MQTTDYCGIITLLKSHSLKSHISCGGGGIACSHRGKLKARILSQLLSTWGKKEMFLGHGVYRHRTDSYPVDNGEEPELGPANGGLMGSRELQGGRMLIIKRPQVAKFMFI